MRRLYRIASLGLLLTCPPAAIQAGGVADGLWRTLERVPCGSHPSGVYDPVRDRFLVLDASSRSLWAAPLSAGGAWTELEVAGPGPSYLAGRHALLYDAGEDRLLSVRGRGGEVRALPLGTPVWSLLGTGVLSEDHAAVILDPLRGRIVAFGGLTAGTSSNAVSVFDPSAGTWAVTPTLGPTPGRRGHAAAVHDPLRDRMLVFGGFDPTNAPRSGPLAAHDVQLVGLRYNDLWALDLATMMWSEIVPATPDRPAARQGAAAIYDPLRDRMIVAGGAGVSSTSDAWTMDLAGPLVWTPFDMGTASARVQPAAIHDPVRDRLLMFGGSNGSPSNDLVGVDLANGNPTLIGEGTLPAPSRRSGQAAIDAIGRRLIVYGGWGSGASNETWILPLDGASGWSQYPPNFVKPPQAEGPTGVTDRTTNHLVLWGGFLGTAGYGRDLWTLRLHGSMEWDNQGSIGAPPGRQFHSAVMDEANRRMIVFGGLGETGRLADVWQYSFDGAPGWTQLFPSGSGPAARDAHAAVYDPVGERMIVFAGRGAGGALGDVWVLSLGSTPAWEELLPLGGTPAARYFHSAVFDAARRRMVVFGGYSVESDAAWALDLEGTPAWMPLDPGGGAPLGIEHVAIEDPAEDRMIVCGGLDALAQPRALEWESVVVIPPPHVFERLSLGLPYPSPANGTARVSFQLATNKPAEIALLDIQGRTRARLDLGGNEYRGEWRIDETARLEPGVYHLRLRQGPEQILRRLVLVR
jgi:hypothetical protein